MDAREQAIVRSAIDQACAELITQYYKTQCDPAVVGEINPVQAALIARRNVLAELKIEEINGKPKD